MQTQYARSVKFVLLLSLISILLPSRPALANGSLGSFSLQEENSELSLLQVNASVSPDPIVGQEVVLHVEVSANGRDLPDTKVLITVPKEVELLDEVLPWQGAIQKDTPQIFDLRMRVIEAGEWEVELVAAASFGPGASNSDTKRLIITSSLDSATVIDFEDRPVTPPPAFSIDESTTSTSIVNRNNESVSGSELMSQSGTVILQGHIDFEAVDLTPASDPEFYTVQQAVKPLRLVRVEIWDRNLMQPDDYHLVDGNAVTHTDDQGDFQISVSNADPDGDNTGIDPILRIYATDDNVVEVKSPTYGSIYGIQSNDILGDDLIDGVTYPFTYTINSNFPIEAFFIHDLIAGTARDYLANNINWVAPDKVKVNWPQNCSFIIPEVGDDSCYNLGNIYIREVDEWDSDVILHEYSHFVLTQSTQYADGDVVLACASVGFGHTRGTHSSAECAWSEGWADFLQAAIQSDKFYYNSNYTRNNPPSNTRYEIYLDLEIANLLAPINGQSPNGLDDEVAVSTSLWDIFDNSGSTEAWDVIADDINNPSSNGIWTLATGLIPVPPYRRIQDFWSAWDASTNGQECEVAAILRHHNIPLGNVYTLDIQLQPTTGGAVNPSPQACAENYYEAGSTVSLVPAPATGYAFSSWSGDATGTSNPLSVTMDADKTIQANFAPPAPANLTGSSTLNGPTATVTLNWDVVSGTGITYSVYHSPTSPVALTLANRQASSISTNSYSYPTQNTGSEYYVVTAVDAGGNESAASNEVQVQLVPPLLMPSAITSSITAIGNLQNTYDGNTSTASSYSAGCPCGGTWIRFDLGAVKKISQVNLITGTGTFNGRVDYSLDGSTWWRATTFASTNGVWSYNNVAFTARYVRFRQVANATWTVKEAQIRGSSYSAAAPGGLPTTFQLSGSGVFDGQYVNDGDINTRVYRHFCPCGTFIQLDLGAIQDVTQVRYYNLPDAWADNPAGTLLNGRVDYSLDGSVWWAAGNTLSPVSGWQTFSVPFTARYVRLVDTANVAWSIGELEVYGTPYSAGTPGGLAATISSTTVTDVAYARDSNLYTSAYRHSCPCATTGFVLDLGATTSVSKVRFFSRADSIGGTTVNNVFQGKIEYSTNGTSWTQAATTTGTIGQWTEVTVAFQARYVRLTHTYTPSGFVIAEAEVYQ